MNKQNYDKMMHYMRRLETSKFYFGSVVEKSEVIVKDGCITKCGSVCCVVGHFPNIFEGIKWEFAATHWQSPKFTFENDIKHYNYAYVASKVLDLPLQTTSVLFSPWNQSVQEDAWEQDEEVRAQSASDEVSTIVLRWLYDMDMVTHTDSSLDEVIDMLQAFSKAVDAKELPEVVYTKYDTAEEYAEAMDAYNEQTTS